MPTPDTTTASDMKARRAILNLCAVIDKITANMTMPENIREQVYAILNSTDFPDENGVPTFSASSPPPPQAREGDCDYKAEAMAWRKVEGLSSMIASAKPLPQHTVEFNEATVALWSIWTMNEAKESPPPDAQTPQRAESNHTPAQPGEECAGCGVCQPTPPSPASGGESVGTEWLPEGMYPFDSGNTCAVLYHGDVRERDAQWRAEIARLTKSLAAKQRALTTIANGGTLGIASPEEHWKHCRTIAANAL